MFIGLRKAAAATAVVTLSLGLGIGAAQATSLEAMPVKESTEKPLMFLGFDEKVAAENGYDIRKDEQGIEYSIPASTPMGDMTGAVYGPGTQPGDIGIAANYVEGPCGSATFLGNGKSFSTGYTIYPFLGSSVHHTWRVPASSAHGYKVFNLDGYFGGGSWSASRNIDFTGAPYYAYVSTGVVTTSYGHVCGDLNPSDSWYGV